MPRATTTERGVTRSTTERSARPIFEKSSDTEIDDSNATLDSRGGADTAATTEGEPGRYRSDGRGPDRTPCAMHAIGLTSTPETPIRYPKKPRS